jgi:hypothetical protein
MRGEPGTVRFDHSSDENCFSIFQVCIHAGTLVHARTLDGRLRLGLPVAVFIVIALFRLSPNYCWLV